MTAIPTNTPRPRKPAVPPLANGDRLSRDEFERRYEAAPPGVRAELIEGVVYIMASPVSETYHGLPHVYVTVWLGTYHAATPHTLPGDNSTVRLDLDNEPQPDLYLRVHPDAGGQTSTADKGYVVGAPELVVEVAASSSNIDLHAKLNAYRRNGVREYVVVRTYDEAVDWFVLRGSSYERTDATAAGVFRSEAFPGLWLDAPALLAADLNRVLATLRQGLATTEHGAFVARLGRAAAIRQPQPAP